jgi:hypothetical protein
MKQWPWRQVDGNGGPSIDSVFYLIDTLADESKKLQFTKELFHYQIRIE